MKLKELITIVIIMSLGFFSGCEKNNGKFYSLREAYENEWLSVDDLHIIASYYREKTDNGIELSSPDTEKLSPSVATEIKKTYLKNLQKAVPSAKIEDVEIIIYYGTYNDCFVVKVWDDLLKYDLLYSDEYIGGVLFNNYCEREIYVWKK
mgnify:FL=1